jgi:hypothetical protein
MERKRLGKKTLSSLPGFDPAIHASRRLAEIGWMPGSSPGMTTKKDQTGRK